LERYDYSQPGAYFVTICAHKRECLFGKIEDGAMHYYDAGKMVGEWWAELNQKFELIETDSYIVMPNHFHGIIKIVGADLRVCPSKGAHAGAPLPTIVQWFKTMTTNDYINGVKKFGWRPFDGRLWPRYYYEHVIRDDESLNRIRDYIETNPKRWELDAENPGSHGEDDFDKWLRSFKERPDRGKQNKSGK
jgi:REP element-mobilizing transposase RayT